MRQHNAAMFALLCDELTDAVTAGHLPEALREWLKLNATDHLEGFLDDFTETPADVQARSLVLQLPSCQVGQTLNGLFHNHLYHQ